MFVVAFGFGLTLTQPALAPGTVNRDAERPALVELPDSISLDAVREDQPAGRFRVDDDHTR
ncbi:MAG TPA: hypothetical protein VNN79_21470 [Actinomycetota bacterium]|nr:hypothetical protein [Actinomycetota bacterium]